MNGRTSKMINAYSRMSGQGQDRREFKRNWRRLSATEKYQLRKKLEGINEHLRDIGRMKGEIEENRSVRRHLMPEGTRVLWFASTSSPDEAHLHFHRGEYIWSRTTFDALEHIPELSGESFNRFWEFAVDDALPQKHFDMLAEFVASGPAPTAAELAAASFETEENDEGDMT